MHNQEKRVIVHGATGVQGRPVADAFLTAGFSTRIITRDSLKVGDLQTSGAEIVEGDLGSVPSLEKVYHGMNILALHIPFFITPPNDPIVYMKNAMQAAQSAGIKHVIWNTGGPMLDKPIGRASVDFRYHQFETLKASGIPYTVFVPTVYMQNLASPWIASEIAQHDNLAYPLRPKDKIGWMDIADVAKLIVVAAEKESPQNRVYRINGPEALTGQAMVARFSQALNRPIQYTELTPQAFGKQLGMIFGDKAGAAISDDYQFIQANHELMMPYHDMTSVVEQFSVTLTSLEDWVRQHAHIFQKEAFPV